MIDFIIQVFLLGEIPLDLILLILWSFVYWIWGAIVLSRSAAQNECADIWRFCSVSVALTATMASLGGMWSLIQTQDKRGKVYLSSFIPWLITFLWGWGIWSALDSDCQKIYENTYPSLWIYYKMITFSSTILIGLSLIIGILIKLAQGPL